jgi:hypothetical protein
VHQPRQWDERRELDRVLWRHSVRNNTVIKQLSVTEAELQAKPAQQAGQARQLRVGALRETIRSGLAGDEVAIGEPFDRAALSRVCRGRRTTPHVARENRARAGP